MADRVIKALPNLTGTSTRRFGYAGLCVLLALLVTLAIHTYMEVKRELTEVAMSRRGAIAQLAAATLGERLDRIVDLSVSLATRVRFSELVANGEWESAIRILRSVPSEFRFVDRVVLYDVRGTVMADVPELLSTRGANFAFRGWYRGVTQNWKPHVSEVYRRAAVPQRNLFSVSVPVVDRTGTATGILQLQVHLEQFFDWQVALLSQDSGGTTYAVDERGTAAFHSALPVTEQLLNLSDTPAVARLLRKEAGVQISPDASGEEQVYAYMPSRHGWGVVVQQPAAEAFAARENQLRRLLVAYGVIIAFCTAVAGLVIQIVTQHRRTLVDKQMLDELGRRVVERTSELEATNKELESFSYSVSHDLRAPLRAVLGFSKLLVEDHGDKLDEEARRKVKVIQDEAQRMGVLIDDLLAFSRLGRKAMQFADIDMTELARTTYRSLNGHDHTHAEFHLATLPPGKGDRVLLGQVWANLISNAVKFSSTREKPLIEVGAISVEKEHVYFVRDNGAGFDPRYQSKLFGVFQRLHDASEFPGTGVGLALVQRIVVRHGGRVWAEGKPGAGATFYFTLPREQVHATV